MVRVATATLCTLALVVAAGCGDEDEGPTAPPVADLTVTVRPDGRDGPARTRQIVCAEIGPDAGKAVCRRISAGRLAPVPADTACTQIYGGPAEARVEGTLRGEHVDARFERSDGCQIERWDRNRALLGAAPSRG